MKKNTIYPGMLALFYVLTAGLLFSCEEIFDKIPVKNPSVIAPDADFTALTSNNKIAWFNAQNLNHPKQSLTISGLPSEEKIISIDYRPSTGQLYGLGMSSRLYLINEQSGKATALGESSFSPGIIGDNASIDFNPTVDRVRLVTESGQNLRLHPELGTVVAEDGMINGGTNPRIGAVAYTNSVANASSTQLYDIDFATNKLYIQTPPNDGGLEEVGDLGNDFNGMGNFDINPDNSAAFAVTLDGDMSKLFSINLQSGRSDWLGDFAKPVLGIAFKTDPVAYAANKNNKLFRFNPMHPEKNTVDITGLMDGEHIVGLDFRPINGTLFGISNKSRLLTVNTSNGAVAIVGNKLDPQIEGHSFGFDFNPTVDRIRLVSNKGQNLRLHPDLGTVVAIDGDLNPDQPFVNGAAYTNSIAGAETTTLFVLDSEADMLFKQDPPNDGVLVPVGTLGVHFNEDNGFDIGGDSEKAFALLKCDDGTAIYEINLQTGKAFKIADFNIEATSIALGLGF